jgi:spermidine synthase
LTEANGLFCLFTRQKGYSNIQGCVYGKRPLIIVSEHARALMSAMLLKPQPQRVLILGMGAGVVPMAVRIAAPNAYIETVEKDPEIEKICKDLFYYQPDKLTRTYLADGRQFAEQAAAAGAAYDLVIINILTAKYMPDHMMTIEFLETLQSIMHPGAVIAVNTLADSRLYSNESVTYSAVFGPFFNFHTDNGHRIIVAAKGGVPGDATVQDGARRLARLYMLTFGINVNELLTRLDDEPDWQSTARMITDQHSATQIINGPVKTVIRKYTKMAFIVTIAVALTAVFVLVKLLDAAVAKRTRAASA